MGIVNDKRVARAAQQAIDVLRVAADAYSDTDGPLDRMTMGRGMRVAYDHARECGLVHGPAWERDDDAELEIPFAMIVALGTLVATYGDEVLAYEGSLRAAYCEDAIAILAGSMAGGVTA